MVLEWIAGAAAAGGTALIGAVATDVWEAARQGVVKLFGRGGQRRAELVAGRLDQDAAAIEAAGPGERDQVRARLLPGWQARLADLLEEFPDAREELDAWAQRVRAQLPPAQVAWVQNNTARDHGTVFAVQHGTQNVYQGPATGPGPVPGTGPGAPA